MTTRTYPLRAGQAFSALVFATACGLTACGDDGDPNMQSPYGNGYTSPEASTVVVGGSDAGTTTMQPPVTTGTQDSGTTMNKPLDAGTTPIVTADTGVAPTVDAGIAVVPEGGVAAEGGAPVADKGMGDGKDVVCIGDSWMSYSGTEGIEYSVQKASKQTYRKYGVSGTKLLDEVIPNQYETAKKAGAIKTVIMTGGGNDIIQDKLLDCGNSSFGKTCTDQIDKVAARLTKLWAEMGTDGVQDVVIVGYTTKADILEPLSKSAEYSNMKIPPLCAAVAPPLRCHVLDSDMAAPDLKLRDGIHPDSAGFDKIGAAVWELMKAQGIRR